MMFELCVLLLCVEFLLFYCVFACVALFRCCCLFGVVLLRVWFLFVCLSCVVDVCFAVLVFVCVLLFVFVSLFMDCLGLMCLLFLCCCCVCVCCLVLLRWFVCALDV